MSASSATASAPNFAHLLPVGWTTEVTAWLKEDTPSFDYGGFVVGDSPQVAHLLGKSPGVVAGRPFFDEVFRQLGCRVEWLLEEGVAFDPVTVVAKVYGPANKLLQGERVALNTLARCSGIATLARSLADLKAQHGFKGVVAGTRKTTPGFRFVEKYGMLVGGVDGHRHDLSSMIMLKDNHIWSHGSITKAVQLARQAGGFSLKIEVECQNEQEADEAIAAGADIVMLDNHAGEKLIKASQSVRERWAQKGKTGFLIEASGGITKENIVEYFGPHVDIISLGALSQGVPHVDFSLKIQQHH
ncbi:nicotinate-nucleotide diphosphorylase [Ramicandelaber brevisporus]|nr:nicotinate-nucleotide diphosphorylase [Ramicandelaber brevisporus]